VRAGHPLLLRYGAKVRLTESRVERAEGFMRRRGVPLVVVMRFLPVLRRIGGLTAGTSEMPLAQFAVANLIGAAIWSSAWVEIGNQAGAHLDRLSKVLSGRGVILAGAAVVVLALGALAVRRRSAPNHPEPETP
jgi:membrane protein DedA with SNARE-associated domain